VIAIKDIRKGEEITSYLDNRTDYTADDINSMYVL
jgi:hypothetical protein